jgi:hypothetical protein
MAEVTAFVAEFQKDARGPLRLWALTTFEKDRHSGREMRKSYDVAWSRTFGSYLFEMSGAGGTDCVSVSGIYFAKGPVVIKETPCTLVHGKDLAPWLSPETTVIRERNRTRRLGKLPRLFADAPNGNLLAWLEDQAIQDSAVWCSQCADNLPGEALCEHMWWCDGSAWYSTPSERCGCATRAVCSGDFYDHEEKFAFSPAHPPLREGRPWW